MWGFVRVALAILVLPVSVTVLIPIWIARSQETAVVLPDSWPGWLLFATGAAILLPAAILFLSCVTRFWVEGRGTLAPWDPPRSLIVSGPYGYVRNPMISAVLLVLLAEGLLLRSLPHLIWAGLFFVVNAVVILLFEEPILRAGFGEQYVRYCRHVPRLVPRLRPYRGRERFAPETADASRSNERSSSSVGEEADEKEDG